MTHTNLYRGTSNNGVGTILTEAAVMALVERNEIFERTGSFRGTEALLEISYAGTFTFVDADESAYFRTYVTGTWDDFDTWRAGREVGNYGGWVFVPFSNGTVEEDRKHIRTAAEVIKAFGLAAPTS